MILRGLPLAMTDVFVGGYMVFKSMNGDFGNLLADAMTNN